MLVRKGIINHINNEAVRNGSSNGIERFLVSATMADEDLKAAVRQALEKKGVIKDLKARLRSEVYQCLEDKTFKMPDKPPDVFLATELVRELLISLKMENTLAVFCEEMGQPTEMRCDREFIGDELGFNVSRGSAIINVLKGKENSPAPIPLLVQLVNHLRQNKAT